MVISIHSAARAETTYANDHVLPCNISIHSAARAETDEYGHRLTGLDISIHSAARAETAIIHNNLYYSPSHFHKQII